MICSIVMRAVFLTNAGRTHYYCYCPYQPKWRRTALSRGRGLSPSKSHFPLLFLIWSLIWKAVCFFKGECMPVKYGKIFWGEKNPTNWLELVVSGLLEWGKGFPGGASGKELACQCRRHKRYKFDPWVRKISWRRAWQPTPVFLPGESAWTEEPGGQWSMRLQRVRQRLKWLSMHAFLTYPVMVTFSYFFLFYVFAPLVFFQRLRTSHKQWQCGRGAS